MKKEDFVSRILDGVAPSPKKASKATSAASFCADDVFGNDDSTTPSAPPPADTRFAQLLLEEVFAHGEAQPRDEIVLGDQKTGRFLPNAGIYWPKVAERPFHIVLFELDKKGRELLADPFFRQQDLLEDALHRIVQDVLDGFEKKRTASARQGAQTETLCVVSIVDDRASSAGRQLVCFGTKSTTTGALEVFTLREDVRDWDRPLAEEHLDQLFSRHFEKLASGAKWQDAFITGAERKKIKDLLVVCTQGSLLGVAEEELRRKLRDVLDEIAGSFGIHRKSANKNRRLDMIELPVNHGIGADPVESQRPGFKNPLQGVRIYDRNERLLGFIVYVASTKAKVEPLRKALASSNHFHNVLVIYPDSAEPELELWQGSTPLRGRLTRGPKRTQFDGEGGVVQLLSRFFVVSKSAIEKSKQLAEELAWRAQHLKALAVDELETEIESGNDKGPLKKLFDTFNAALVTLTVEKFADAYAQTITYGMLAARWISSGETPLFTRKNLKDLLPETSSFLKDLFDKLVNSNFDKNLSWLLDDITSLLARTSVAQVFQDEKRDPSIHFYEDFLDAYDSQVRKDQGVYYTPDEVVSYIVRTAHSSLQNDFGLPLGLADTTTWGAFAKANELALPEEVDPKAPFVQVLDPALGTGTFLLRVIEVVHETMQAEFQEQGLDEEAAKKAWVSYVRKSLLPRINGFELMMAPYIVSHLRLGLALQETGFTFTKSDRLRVFLTNTLETHTSSQLSFIGEHVADEAQAASTAKLKPGISVVIGNPPYSVTSQNRGAWISEILEDFKKGLSERKLNLDDDFVKFLRYASYRIEQCGAGIVGLITNHIFLSAVTHRQIRRHLIDQFDTILITDLHGDSRYGEDTPDGVANENVFNIQQGVAAFQLASAGRRNSQTNLLHADVWGTRKEKLSQLRGAGLIEFSPLTPSAPDFMFFPRELQHDDLYRSWPSVTDWFSVHTNGIETHRDAVTVHYTREELEATVDMMLSGDDTEELRANLATGADGGQWKLRQAVACLRSLGQVERYISPITYRPFDIRHTVIHPGSTGFLARPRWEVTGPSLAVSPNIGLATARLKARGGEWDSAVVSRYPTEKKTADSTRSSAFFPLWLKPGTGIAGEETVCNLSSAILEALRTKCSKVDEVKAFNYVVAILHSPSYRATFHQQLATGFPRVPIPTSSDLLLELAGVGRRVVDAFLLDVEAPNVDFAKFVDGGDRRIRRVGEKNQSLNAVRGGGGSLQLNDRSWFEAIPLEAWEIRVGGYQPCHKWLNDRKKDGRILSDEDIETYRRIVAGCQQLARCRTELNIILAKRGAWGDVFGEGHESRR